MINSIVILFPGISKNYFVEDDLLNQTQKNAEQIIEGLSNKQFNPNSGENCSRYDFSSICRWREDTE